MRNWCLLWLRQHPNLLLWQPPRVKLDAPLTIPVYLIRAAPLNTLPIAELPFFKRSEVKISRREENHGPPQRNTIIINNKSEELDEKERDNQRHLKKSRKHWNISQVEVLISSDSTEWIIDRRLTTIQEVCKKTISPK
jgi:hypothetical protein